MVLAGPLGEGSLRWPMPISPISQHDMLPRHQKSGGSGVGNHGLRAYGRPLEVRWSPSRRAGPAGPPVRNTRGRNIGATVPEKTATHSTRTPTCPLVMCLPVPPVPLSQMGVGPPPDP